MWILRLKGLTAFNCIRMQFTCTRRQKISFIKFNTDAHKNSKRRYKDVSRFL